MGLSAVVSFSLAAADADGICQSQTPGGAGSLTLNGALVSGGVATLGTGNTQRRVLVTPAADETGRVFTVTGTDANGNAITDTIAGGNATATSSTLDFQTVTDVSVDAGTAGAVTVGTSGVGATPWVPFDVHRNPFNIGFGVVVSGTVTYQVQHTFDRFTVPGDAAPTAFAHEDLGTDQTASQDGNYAYPVRGMRIEIQSGTGSIELTATQAGIRGG